jgi:RNA polymerase sporulation-specific sigma factor
MDVKLQERPAYSEMPDEELAELAQRGDERALEYLLRRYRKVVRKIASSYFLTGADREDVVQEGMIGLYKAIRDFRRSHGAPFRAFAPLCITRQIITAVKTATRHKHEPLNAYFSLNEQVFEDNPNRMFVDITRPGDEVDLTDLIAGREAAHRLLTSIYWDLTAMERRVLRMYLDGKSYAEMAAELGRTPKSVDNALQRVKYKAKKRLAASEGNPA